MCWISFYVTGTSSSTSTYITLPNISKNTSNLYYQFAIHAVNGSTDAVGIGSMAPNAYNVYFYPNGALDNWGTGGTKTVIGEFWYQLA